MVFSDLYFLFVFLPLFFLLYILSSFVDRRKGNMKLRNAILVAFSLLFYAWGEPVYVLLMVGSVVMNYFAGLVVDKAEGGARKWALGVGVACNIAVLGVFKYADLVAESLSGMGLPISAPHIALPIGISFYTFQAMSYVVDVYRRQAPTQRRFLDLLLYIAMFPQLIAGPIVRYASIAAEIGHRSVSAKDLSDGVFRFLVGLGKKVILANQLSVIVDQTLTHDLASLPAATGWLGIAAFALQIYFDFSGYSDMAIGLGRCLGFHFPENFNHPYLSNSATDFWRRWHISLGSFFRDYVYIPLGGNRRHQAANILVTWFLTGLWHGASWNFILWGVYFGFWVAIEKHTILKIKSPLLQPLLHLYSLAIVLFGWVIFYFDDMGEMLAFLRAATGGNGVLADITSQVTLTDNFWLWAAAIVFCLPLKQWLRELATRMFPNGHRSLPYLSLATKIAIGAALLVVSATLLVGATNNPFIYTRF